MEVNREDNKYTITNLDLMMGVCATWVLINLKLFSQRVIKVLASYYFIFTTRCRCC